MPRVLGGSLGGGRFLMNEVPLYTGPTLPHAGRELYPEPQNLKPEPYKLEPEPYNLKAKAYTLEPGTSDLKP